MYVYYGQQSDYDYLESVGINVSGKIVMARYGKLFRANIVIILPFCKISNYEILIVGGLGREERRCRSVVVLGSQGFRPERQE